MLWLGPALPLPPAAILSREVPTGLPLRQEQNGDGYSMHVGVYVCLSVGLPACLSICLSVCTHVRTYVCVYAYAGVSTNADVNVGVDADVVFTCISAKMCRYRYKHMHIHMHMCATMCIYVHTRVLFAMIYAACKRLRGFGAG